MTNTVLLKRSSVANSAPSSLSYGELAINYTDGNLYYQNASNVVTVIASNKFLTVSGNVTGGNIVTTGLISATGNITGGNLITAGQITATGTITSTGATNSTGFAVGNSAVSNVGLGFFPTAGTRGDYAIRDYSTVTSTIYLDVGMGGSASGEFQFRTSNAFTLLARVDSTGITTPGRVYGLELNSTQSSGSEGGQINLALPASGTTLSGNVIIDVYNNLLRFYEGGGTNRGAFIDLTAATAGVGSNLLAGGSATTPTKIQNGTSEANIGTSGGNANITIGGVSNVAIFTTAGLVANSVAATNNGNGTNFKVGDDAWLGDINQADTMSIRGQQNAANAYIVFGNADNTQLGRAGSGPLTYGAGFTATGNVTGGNVLGSALFATSTTANAVTARLATGNDNNFKITAQNGVASNTTGTEVGRLGINYVGTGWDSFTQYIRGSAAQNGAQVLWAANTAIANITSTGLAVTGIVSATGNVTGGNVNGGNIIATGNVTGGNVAATTQVYSFNTMYAVGNITGGNLITGGQVVATGNISGGNISATGSIGTTGNITGGALSGNTLSLQGNANVGNISVSSSLFSSSISSASNITVAGANVLINATANIYLNATGNILANSRYINNLASPVQAQDAATKTYVDTAVGTAYTAGSGLTLTAGAFSVNTDGVTTSIISGNVVVPAGATFTTPNIGAATGISLTTSGNVTANVLKTANISIDADSLDATANLNITASLGKTISIYTGAGSEVDLTGNGVSINTVSGANTYTWDFGTSGNLTLPTGKSLTATGNISAANLIASSNISATGNVSGTYFLGNGALLTGIVSTVSSLSNGNSNVSITSAGGNVEISVNGIANTMVVAPGRVDVLGAVNINGLLATAKNITANSVVADGMNSLLISPVTIGNGISVTVPSTSTLYIFTPT